LFLSFDVSWPEVAGVTEGEAVVLYKGPVGVVSTQVRGILLAVVDLVHALPVQIVGVLTVSAPPGTVGLGVGSVDADTGADLLSVAGFLVGTVRISCNLGGCGRRWGVLSPGQDKDCGTNKCS